MALSALALGGRHETLVVTALLLLNVHEAVAPRSSSHGLVLFGLRVVVAAATRGALHSLLGRMHYLIGVVGPAVTLSVVQHGRGDDLAFIKLHHGAAISRLSASRRELAVVPHTVVCTPWANRPQEVIQRQDTVLCEVPVLQTPRAPAELVLTVLAAGLTYPLARPLPKAPASAGT